MQKIYKTVRTYLPASRIIFDVLVCPGDTEMPSYISLAMFNINTDEFYLLVDFRPLLVLSRRRL